MSEQDYVKNGIVMRCQTCRKYRNPLTNMYEEDNDWKCPPDATVYDCFCPACGESVIEAIREDFGDGR